jgi:hypothetical protein
VFDWGSARVLLRANVPGAIWDDASKNEADNSYRVNGTKDGVESYYASLTDDGKMLTPLLMNAGTGLYNSDYTQPFKNPRKAPGP